MYSHVWSWALASTQRIWRTVNAVLVILDQLFWVFVSVPHLHKGFIWSEPPTYGYCNLFVQGNSDGSFWESDLYFFWSQRKTGRIWEFQLHFLCSVPRIVNCLMHRVSQISLYFHVNFTYKYMLYAYAWLLVQLPNGFSFWNSGICIVVH